MLLGPRKRQIQHLPTDIVEEYVDELLGGFSEFLGKVLVFVVQSAIETELLDEPLALGIAASNTHHGGAL